MRYLVTYGWFTSAAQGMHVAQPPVALAGYRVSYLLCGCEWEHQQGNDCVERNGACEGHCLYGGHHQGLLNAVEVAHNCQPQAGIGTD
jgi:hypothetical protein